MFDSKIFATLPFMERCRTPSWWRRARISSCSAARRRKEAERDAKSAAMRGPNGDRRKNDNPQSINHIGIYEKHNFAAAMLRTTTDGLHSWHERGQVFPFGIGEVGIVSGSRRSQSARVNN